MELAEGPPFGEGAVDGQTDILEHVEPHRLCDGEGPQVLGGGGIAPVETDMQPLGAEMRHRLEGWDK